MKKFYLLILMFCFFQNCNVTKPVANFAKLLWAADYNSDNDLIAVGGNHGKLYLLSSDNLKTINTYEMPNTITKIKWHPTKNLLAVIRQQNDGSGSNDTQTKLINPTKGTTIQLDNFGGRGLGWSSNGEYLAIGDYEGVLNIFTLEGKLFKKIKTEQKAIIGLSWHPQKMEIVTVGSHIEIVNLLEESTKKIIPREQEILMLCVEWHPSGASFVTGDYGNSDIYFPALLQFWDADGNKIKEVGASPAEYRNLQWVNQGKYLLTANDKIRKWDANGNLISSNKKGSLFWGLDFNEKIVTTTEYGEVLLLNEKLKTIKKVNL